MNNNPFNILKDVYWYFEKNGFDHTQDNYPRIHEICPKLSEEWYGYERRCEGYHAQLAWDRLYNTIDQMGQAVGYHDSGFWHEYFIDKLASNFEKGGWDIRHDKSFRIRLFIRKKRVVDTFFNNFIDKHLDDERTFLKSVYDFYRDYSRAFFRLWQMDLPEYSGDENCVWSVKQKALEVSRSHSMESKAV